MALTVRGVIVASRNRQSPHLETHAIPEVVSFGPFRIIVHERRLERGGVPIQIGSRAFDLLCLLIDRPGEVISKRELLAKAWPDLSVDESSLRFHIAQLRRALGDGQGDGERYVTNVPGRGYCFVARLDSAPPRKQLPPRDEAPTLNVPPKPARIIGRDVDVVAIAEHLLARRFVTLRGPGGVGKTTVAIAIAHQLGHRFRDGVRFLDLGSVNDPALVAVVAASAFNLLVPVEDPTPRLIESLRDRELLLVFDSCEHVVEAAARLAEQIYQQAPNVFVLATSRESLETTGEFVFPLSPLEIPPEGPEGQVDLARYDSAKLFMQCAAAAGYAAPLPDAHAQTIASICRKLDGMPLAIELVASRLSAHGLIELAELIEGRLRLAWPGRRTAPLRHRSLNAALDWSYNLLSPGGRSLLQSLSVFPSTFSLQGARAVADELSETDVYKNLEQLVAKSMVTSRPTAVPVRFRLLETTRVYASEKLAASGGARTARLKHARYVLQALRPRSYEPGGDRPGGWTRRAELLADARTALVWAYSESGEPDVRLPLAAVCARLFAELNLLQECRVWSGRALDAMANTLAEQTARVELLWAYGHAAMFSQRNSYECEAALRRGLELARSVGDPQNQLRLLSRLHALYRRTGERRLLMEVAQFAEDVATQLADPAALARAHTYMGVAYHLTGDQRLARERLQAGDAATPRSLICQSITLPALVARILCRAPIFGYSAFPTRQLLWPTASWTQVQIPTSQCIAEDFASPPWSTIGSEI